MSVLQMWDVFYFNHMPDNLTRAGLTEAINSIVNSPMDIDLHRASCELMVDYMCSFGDLEAIVGKDNSVNDSRLKNRIVSKIMIQSTGVMIGKQGIDQELESQRILIHGKDISGEKVIISLHQ